MPDTKPSDKKDDGWMLSDRGEADLLKFYHEHPEALAKFTDAEDVFRPSGESTENVFGEALDVANVFCATGEGGGVDPTCSPRNADTTAITAAEKWVGDQESWRDKVTTKLTSVSGRDIRPAPGIQMTSGTIKKYERQIEKAVSEGKPLRPVVAAKDESGKYFLHDGNHYFRALTNLKKAGKLPDVKEIPVLEVLPKDGYHFETKDKFGMYVHELTQNVFCPTGEGGGTDPTCSRSDPEGDKRVRSVLTKLSPQMRKTVSAYIKGVRVHKDSEALTEHLREEGHRVEDNHRQATYVRGTGVIHLTEGVKDEVIAHELGHVLDGRMESISNDHAFKRAWQKEGKKLSDYATANPAEGLAELIRLYMEEGSATITKRVPAMIKALKSMGYKDL